ncbi:MAG: twin-arginine translocation signal domain-containing protein [Armatimonadetes bacterium]|nr:twin-arginine translocation signal domain-containing protein [Armatimonadota bacterium]
MSNNLSRRDFIATTTAAAVVGPFAASAPAQQEPMRLKAKNPKLRSRTEPEVYTGADLKYIGMPIGGLFAGTVYLGGDGQLWNWDVFNQKKEGAVERTNTTFMGETLSQGTGANYVDPVHQQSPFNQRFELILLGKPEKRVHFGTIKFRGEYPVGKVSYSQADADVEMTLVAFSPFVPLEVESSSFPATTLTFAIKNTGAASASYRLQYFTDNPVLSHSRTTRSDFRLMSAKTDSGGVLFSAQPTANEARRRRPVIFENWSSGTYGKWVTTGTAFGPGPRKVTDLPSYMGPVHAGTEYVVNTHNNLNGEDVVQADQHVGTLTSPEFTIDRDYINMRVGGGSHKGQTCVNLLIDGRVVRSITGHDSNEMAWTALDVRGFNGQTAVIQVIDGFTGGWGQISLGEVEFSDTPRNQTPLVEAPDFGTFCVEFVGGSDVANDIASRTVELQPGETKEVTLVVAWHFPNVDRSLPAKTNWYASKWKDAAAVAADLIANWTTLRDKTLAWNRTWYDSTLPHWFLDRTFVNTSILATTTCHRFEDGRFYFWEGIGCCAGTCTHVWGYAQAIGRVFPEVERYLRSKIDFDFAFHKDSGAIDYRAEYHRIVAHDGQCGCILRAYREHQMSADKAFLTGIWPNVKQAMQYLINQDQGHDGILDGAQYNTLDTAWYGEIAWISSLYVAALRASEAMAKDMNDSEFADQCRSIAESGSQRLVSQLFNGEYFIHKIDPNHPESNNTNKGCHIDQLYGQSWAHQVGLPRIVPKKEALSALGALFKYSFYDDVWEYRRKVRGIPGGRWYAIPGDPGLVMCSFPHGGAAESVGKGGDAWATGYFNECMSGFEYQVAAHMIAEDMVDEGLALVYAIHHRYRPSMRNPYNEIECSDHYGRAMASYGAYVSMCGFQVDGPNHKMSFAPKAKGAFRCAFINEQGWGTYSRTGAGKESVEYAHRI